MGVILPLSEEVKMLEKDVAGVHGRRPSLTIILDGSFAHVPGHMEPLNYARIIHLL